MVSDIPWFKVDDKLHSHPKAMRAGESLALWTLAGSWCMDQLMDGFIPSYVALRLLPNAEEHAAKLVSAGLWSLAERDGETGWQFHDWPEYQPTKAQVTADREAAKERQQRARERAREAREKSQNASRERHGVTNGVTSASPTRPDPTRSSYGTTKDLTAPRKARGARIPEDFALTPDMREWAHRSGMSHLDIDGITDNFRDYWTAETGAKATKLDWIATWRTWVRREAERRKPRTREMEPSTAWDRSEIVRAPEPRRDAS